MKKSVLVICIGMLVSLSLSTQEKFNGLGINIGNLYRLSDAKSRSISPENFNGEKGKGGMATTGTGAGPSRDLGQKWKVKPERGHKKAYYLYGSRN